MYQTQWAYRCKPVTRTYKRVAISLRLMSRNSKGVSYAMSFLLFALLAVLAVVVLMLVVYLLGRRWL